MAQLSAEEFEARWQSLSKGPTVRTAEIQPIQLDLSLSGMLDQYMTMVNGLVAQGKISKIDQDALIAAVAALKAILDRINDKDLVAQAVTDGAKVVQQRVQDRIANLTAAALRR